MTGLEVPSRNFSGGTDVQREKSSKDSRYSGGDSNQVSPKFTPDTSRLLQLAYPQMCMKLFQN